MRSTRVVGIIAAALGMAGVAACAGEPEEPASESSDLTQESKFELHGGIEQAALAGCDKMSSDCYLGSANLDNAYWLALVSNGIYLDDVDVDHPERAAGLLTELEAVGAQPSDFIVFDSSIDGSHGVYFQVGDVGVLAFRGTRPSRPQDLVMDAGLTPSDDVHSGFLNGFRALWTGEYLPSEHPTPDGPGVVSVRSDLFYTMMERFPGATDLPERTDGREPYPFQSSPPTSLYITGHSLGGALATVAVDFLTASHEGGFLTLPSNTSVYIYGAPRVGNGTFAAALLERTRNVSIPYYRFVHHRDPVTAVPSIFGYQHLGATFEGDTDGLGTRIHISAESGEAELMPGENPAGNGSAFDLGDHDMENYMRIILQLTEAD